MPLSTLAQAKHLPSQLLKDQEGRNKSLDLLEIIVFPRVAGYRLHPCQQGMNHSLQLVCHGKEQRECEWLLKLLAPLPHLNSLQPHAQRTNLTPPLSNQAWLSTSCPIYIKFHKTNWMLRKRNGILDFRKTDSHTSIPII